MHFLAEILTSFCAENFLLMHCVGCLYCLSCLMLLYLPHSNGVAFKSNKFMIKLNLSTVLENVKSDDKQIKKIKVS